MTPFELVSRRVAPYVRALVALELLREGASQGEVARALGVTQPMVRKYARAGARARRALEEAGIAPEAVQAAVGALAESAKRGYWEYVSALSSLMASMLSRGTLCSLHRRLDRRVPESCSLCSGMFYGPSDPYVEDAAAALALLQSNPSSYRLVPEVGMNICVAPPEAELPDEVVGFPGRIVRAGTRIAALGRPTYGGSVHTAGVLLMAKRAWRSLRAAISMRYDEGFLREMEAAGLMVVRVDRGPGGSIWEAIARAGGPPDAVADPGGPGVEPIIYVFGGTALEAARKALSALGRR